MVTNHLDGGFVLRAKKVRIFPEFHEKYQLDQIRDVQWNKFKEWVFEWILDTSQKVDIR